MSVASTKRPRVGAPTAKMRAEARPRASIRAQSSVTSRPYSMSSGRARPCSISPVIPDPRNRCRPAGASSKLMASAAVTLRRMPEASCSVAHHRHRCPRSPGDRAAQNPCPAFTEQPCYLPIFIRRKSVQRARPERPKMHDEARLFARRQMLPDQRRMRLQAIDEVARVGPWPAAQATVRRNQRSTKRSPVPSGMSAGESSSGRCCA